MNIFILYFITINIFAFLLYGADKHKAETGKWRIRERTLILIAVVGGSVGSFTGMLFFHHKTHKNKFRIGIPFIFFIQLCSFICITNWLNTYYKADKEAKKAMLGNNIVTVSSVCKGYLFDGPGKNTALIFYPGAADSIRKTLNYKSWIISGHSLGGAIASMYFYKDIKKNANPYTAEIFFASYPVNDFSNTEIPMLSIYGTNDIMPEKIKSKAGNLSKKSETIIIEGGNHAQFGNYGLQKGDGCATISAVDQQSQTVKAIFSFVKQFGLLKY